MQFKGFNGMTFQEYKQKVVEDLFRSRCLFGRDPSFSDVLFQLIAKADSKNRFLLSLGFSTYVGVWEEWYNSPDEQEFFAKYGCLLSIGKVNI